MTLYDDHGLRRLGEHEPWGPDDEQAIRPSWRPDYCVCGHVAGDHSDGRTAWPHEVAGGFCFVGGCDCKRYERDSGA